MASKSQECKHIYPYKALNASKSEIRVLDLEMNEEDDEIRCTLTTISMDSGYEFEALSYVWGAPAEEATITADGHKVSITHSLHVALISFRRRYSLRHNQLHEYKATHRRLWIDQLCINQNDLDEKNMQVRMMWTIYASATTVLVWLGEENEKSAVGMEIVRLLDLKFELQSNKMVADILKKVTINSPDSDEDHGRDAGDPVHKLENVRTLKGHARPEDGWATASAIPAICNAAAVSPLSKNNVGKNQASTERAGIRTPDDANGSSSKGNISMFLMDERPVIITSAGPSHEWGTPIKQRPRSEGDLGEARRHDPADIPLSLLLFAHGNSWHRYEDPEEWVAFQKLMERPWWQRIWTVQEVVAANGPIWVGCGSFWLTWSAFVSAALLIQMYERSPYFQSLKRLGSGKSWILERAQLRMRKDGRLDSWGGLHRLIHSTAMYAASDPRDKIFALLGFTPSVKLIPDYHRSVSDIYEAVSRQSIESSGSLMVLALIRKPKKLSLPSWVPDFSVRIPAEKYNAYHPSGFYGADGNPWAFVGVKSMGLTVGKATKTSELRLTGVTHDVAFALGDIWDAEPMQRQSSFFRVVSQYESLLAKADSSHFPHLMGHHRRESFWRTLVWNSNDQGKYPAPESFGKSLDQLQKSSDYLISGESLSSRSHPVKPEERCIPSGDASKFYHAFVQLGLNRRFFITSTGHLGSGPPDMRVGDIVCVILGATCPMILRRVHSCDGYELVGTAYVHGIMHGEALSKAYIEASVSWQDRRKSLSFEEFRLV